MEIPLFKDRQWSTCPHPVPEDDALPHLGPRAVPWMLEGNERARRFYEKAGWSADGVTRDAPMGGEPTLQPWYARTAAR